MTPYYADDLVTIYHGDSREVLPSLGPVGALITDPPFGVGFDYGTGLQDDEAGHMGRIWPVIEAAEALVDAGPVAVYQAAKYARKWAEWFPREWRPIALPKSFIQMRRTSPQWATDYVLLWSTPGTPAPRFEEWMPKPNRDWYVSKSPNFKRGIDHPCPRPLDQVEYLVRLLVAPDKTVLDPFMGSGTTMLAAQRLGRRSIGIELEERYCEVAVQRLQQEVMGLTA